MKRKIFPAKRRWVWAGAGAAALIVLVSGGSIHRYWIQVRELRRLDQKRQETLRRIEVLEARRARSENDTEFIENMARRELGLLGANEIEFRFQ